MIRRRAFLASASTAALLGTAAACGEGGGSSDGVVTLEFWHSMAGASAETADSLIAAFNADHEGSIIVQATYQGSYEETVAKLTATAQAGNLPDIVQINDVNSGFMADSKLTVPVDQVLSDHDLADATATLVPLARNYYSVQDTLLSLPFQVSEPAVYIRPDALEATGTSIEDFPTDHEGLALWARDHLDATGRPGLTFHLTPWWMEEFTASLGQEYCTPANGTSEEKPDAFRFTDPAQIELWSLYQDLFTSGAALDVGSDGTAATNAFNEGAVGAVITSSGAYGNVADALGDGFHIAPFPVAEGGGIIPGGNSLWVLQGEDEVLAAAAEFLAYAISDDVQLEIFQATGYLPAAEGSLDAARATASPAQEAFLDQLEATPTTVATAGCHSGALQSVRNEVEPALSQVMQGADVEETFAGLEDTTGGVVADYNERAGL